MKYGLVVIGGREGEATVLYVSKVSVLFFLMGPDGHSDKRSVFAIYGLLQTIGWYCLRILLRMPQLRYVGEID